MQSCFSFGNWKKHRNPRSGHDRESKRFNGIILFFNLLSMRIQPVLQLAIIENTSSFITVLQVGSSIGASRSRLATDMVICFKPAVSVYLK